MRHVPVLTFPNLRSFGVRKDCCFGRMLQSWLWALTRSHIGLPSRHLRQHVFNVARLIRVRLAAVGSWDDGIKITISPPVLLLSQQDVSRHILT